MTFTAFRLNEPDLQEWYNSKKNKSATAREALKLLYQTEKQKEYEVQDKKIKVEILG